MNLVVELADKLKEAANQCNVKLCMELSDKIAKVMETYKRSC